MPRLARVVYPNIPYHITQRGNRREDVFFCNDDYEFYLTLLKKYCKKYDVDIWAYCLMTNHVHLILKPTEEDGLQKVLKPLHMRYAQHINKKQGWKGHLWQGRFFSSALDEAYAYSAIRYVEQNPVRAGMAEQAEEYKWSSAARHVGLVEDELLADIPSIYCALEADEWEAYLREAPSDEHVEVLRRNVDKGLPCGSDDFIDLLEGKTKRALKYRPIGRPRKG